MLSSSIEIIPVTGSKLLREFLAVPDFIYADDPAWRPQLKFERAAHLNPQKNPGAAALENRQLFLAKRGEEFVGRIAAFINPAHDSHYSETAGFFGFFDCEENKATGASLLEAAQFWLQTRKVERIIGPAQWLSLIHI